MDTVCFGASMLVTCAVPDIIVLLLVIEVCCDLPFVSKPFEIEFEELTCEYDVVG